jgi:hypothetical protein
LAWIQRISRPLKVRRGPIGPPLTADGAARAIRETFSPQKLEDALFRLAALDLERPGTNVKLEGVTAGDSSASRGIFEVEMRRQARGRDEANDRAIYRDGAPPKVEVDPNLSRDTVIAVDTSKWTPEDLSAKKRELDEAFERAWKKLGEVDAIGSLADWIPDGPPKGGDDE